MGKLELTVIQLAQNVLARFLNNSVKNDRVNNKDIKMLSVNQMNAQIKLTEIWKSINISDYPTLPETKRCTTSSHSNVNVKKGTSKQFQSAFIYDAAKI
jgi:hypothetical protein